MKNIEIRRDTLASKLDDFEIFRWNNYREQQVPNGSKFKINQEPYLDIVLTDKCNRHCQFCIADLLDKRDDCNVSVFKDQISWAVENFGVREVLLVGGEPTIAPALFPILEHLKSVSQIKKVCLTTNGDRLLSRDGTITDFATKLCSSGVTNINLSLMSLHKDIQQKIGGSANAFHLAGLPALHALCVKNGVSLRINSNVFRGNHDTLASIVEFYRTVSPYVHSVKFSPLLRVDNYSVVNKVIDFVVQNILTNEEYESLFKSVEEYFSDYPVVRNPLTFGFVEYSMIIRETPIILNYNHRGQMAAKAALGLVNNLKLLTNGNLSLSWNKDDDSKVVRFPVK